MVFIWWSEFFKQLIFRKSDFGLMGYMVHVVETYIGQLVYNDDYVYQPTAGVQQET